MQEILIRAENLRYRYENTDRNALDDISFNISKGEVIGIIGANAAGKTTLCSAIKGIVPHQFGGSWGGKLEVCGVDVRSSSVSELSSYVSMTFQNPEAQIIGTTVEEDIAFVPENFGMEPEFIREEVDRVMETVRLPAFYKKHQPYAMSGGEKQRLAIASAIISAPQIIIFDEPTTELDPVGKYEVLQIVKKISRERGNTVIVVEQDIEYLITVADRLFVLNEGKLVLQGKTRDVMARGEILKSAGVNMPDVVKLWHNYVGTGNVFVSTEEALSYFRPLDLNFNKSFCNSCLEVANKADSVKYNNVGFSYIERPVLHDIDLTIKDGEFIAVLGKNGAGKTTMVKHLNGLLKPNKGSVMVCGQETKNNSVAMLAKNVAYVFQNPDHQLFAQTVEEEIAFGPRNLGWSEETVRKKVDEAIAFGKLEEYRKESPLSLERGLKQILILCSVIAMDVKVFVVDEPTTGLGSYYKAVIGKILDKLNTMGKTVILVTHDMEFVAAHAKRIIVVSDGTVTLDGDVREIFSEKEKLRASYVFPPQISDLALQLGAKGEFIPLNVEEFGEVLNEHRKLY